jgi:hypothetical protein
MAHAHASRRRATRDPARKRFETEWTLLPARIVIGGRRATLTRKRIVVKPSTAPSRKFIARHEGPRPGSFRLLRPA